MAGPPWQAETPTGRARVQMVDLAGSERESKGKAGERRGQPQDSRGVVRRDAARHTKNSRALSERLRETAQIKKALSNLGIIIKSLSKGEAAVGLPFRDSLLTWLLKVSAEARRGRRMGPWMASHLLRKARAARPRSMSDMFGAGCRGMSHRGT